MWILKHFIKLLTDYSWRVCTYTCRASHLTSFSSKRDPQRSVQTRPDYQKKGFFITPNIAVQKKSDVVLVFNDGILIWMKVWKKTEMVPRAIHFNYGYSYKFDSLSLSVIYVGPKSGLRPKKY